MTWESFFDSAILLLGAKGIATRSDRTLLVAPGPTTRNKDATFGAPSKYFAFRTLAPSPTVPEPDSELTDIRNGRLYTSRQIEYGSELSE